MPRLLSPRALASSRLSLEVTLPGGRRARAASRARVAVARASSLTIARPDDWHLHVRDASKLADVVPFTSKTFKRALVMPNLTPPVRTASVA